MAQSSTTTWPASDALLANVVLVADLAVVRDMHVGHDPVVVADARHAGVLDGAQVEGAELADVLRSPISRRVGSPAYFLSCGTSPSEQNWKMRLSRPIRV
jgi:hypothetical protein